MLKRLIGISVLPVQYIVVSVLAHAAFFFLVFLGAFQEPDYPKQVPRSTVMEVAIYHAPPKIKTSIPSHKNEVSTNKGSNHSSPKVSVRDIHIPDISVEKPKEMNSSAMELRQDVSEVAELSPIVKKPYGHPTEHETSPISMPSEPTYKPTKSKRIETLERGGVDWLSMFPAMVAAKVQERLPSTPVLIKAQCSLSIRLAADGTLIEIDNSSGEQELCNNAKSILHSIGKFDLPENIPDKQSFLRHLIINVESATQ